MTARDDKSCTDTERLAIAEGKRMARRIFEKRGNHSEAHLSEEELSTLLAAVYEIAKESAPSHALPNGVPAFDPVAFYRAFPAGGNNERGDWLSRCLANMLDAYEVAKQAGCAPSTTPLKPRGTYEPLTEEHVEKWRRWYSFSHQTETFNGSTFDRLCDMAISSLLYAQEIDRLRSLQSATRDSILEEAARACEKRAERRFDECGTREPDTNATYYGGSSAEEYDTRDEEDADCAAAVRALKNRADGGVKANPSHGTRGGPEGEGP